MVTFHYELKDADTGVLLESTDSAPKQYIHGVSEDIIPVLANAFTGMAKGNDVEDTISPEQAFHKNTQSRYTGGSGYRLR